MPLSTTRLSNATAPLAKNEEKLCVGVIVPEDRVGALIGSQGAGLEQLRSQSGGCNLDVLKREAITNANRRINLIGNEQQIRAAFGLVCQKALQSDGQTAATVFIPASIAGRVIGKDAENVKLVRQLCRFKVNIGREPVTDLHTGRQERSLTLEGDSCRLSQAFSLALFGSKAIADVVAETLSLSILIPEDRVGHIIGSNGCGLKEAQIQSHGCKVEAVREPETKGSRRLNLTGDIDQISTAFGLFCNKIYQEEAQEALIVLIPENRTGPVVGKGGENLKMIRETCGIKISLGRDAMLATQTGRQERSLVFEGVPHRLRQAFLMTLQLLARSVTCVQPPSEDMEHVQIHMLIPDHHVGTVVGKDGTNIKQIGVDSGCNCAVTPPDGGVRRVVINGTFEQAEDAQTSIWLQMQAAAQEMDKLPTTAHVIFFVRKEAAGVVLGSGGAQLRSFGEQSSTYMRMGKNELQGHRAVSISGPFQSVLLAENLVFDAVKDVEVTPSATSKKRKASCEVVEVDEAVEVVRPNLQVGDYEVVGAGDAKFNGWYRKEQDMYNGKVWFSKIGSKDIAMYFGLPSRHWLLWDGHGGIKYSSVGVGAHAPPLDWQTEENNGTEPAPVVKEAFSEQVMTEPPRKQYRVKFCDPATKRLMNPNSKEFKDLFDRKFAHVLNRIQRRPLAGASTTPGVFRQY